MRVNVIRRMMRFIRTAAAIMAAAALTVNCSGVEQAAREPAESTATTPAELKATIERGQADADLEASGELFGSGTYLVGDEIEPGTYVAEGTIEGCHWERQDRAGEIIDNNFIDGRGRRVEVTIRPSDYAFHSEGCGQWRPVS